MAWIISVPNFNSFDWHVVFIIEYWKLDIFGGRREIDERRFDSIKINFDWGKENVGVDCFSAMVNPIQIGQEPNNAQQIYFLVPLSRKWGMSPLNQLRSSPSDDSNKKAKHTITTPC